MQISSISASRRVHLAPSAAARSQAPRGRLAVSAIAAPVKDTENLPSSESLSQELRRVVAAAPATRRVVLESPEELRSTWEHRAWVGAATGLMAATLVEGVSQLEGVGGALEAGAALFAAYVLADLGTAFYHFFVDNYGDARTPVFGGQIAAFQGHHQRPWTITE